MTTDDREWPAFLAAIVDHIAHPVFVKDREFRWVLLNRAFCAMAGFPREQMIGKSDHDFFPKSEADFFRKKDVEMFETAKDVEIDEEPFTDKAGRRHVLATTKVPLRNTAGQITHLVGIIHDITALKNAQASLRAANEDLERRVAERTRALAAAQAELMRKERLAVLGRLVGGLAHQIRNPLGAIVNATAILEKARGTNATPDERQALAVIHEEVWRANRIIVDLIDFARIRPAEPKPTSLEAIVGSVLVSKPVPAAIDLQVVLPTGLTVSVDRDQVEGALANLVVNAIEAMPDGGKLSLSAREKGDDAAVLVVEDTGPGIPAEVWAHLFEPLVTTKPFGLGLGLTTCRALIDNQGGSITCQTETGKGTRFEVTLRR